MPQSKGDIGIPDYVGPIKENVVIQLKHCRALIISTPSENATLAPKSNLRFLMEKHDRSLGKGWRRGVAARAARNRVVDAASCTGARLIT
ncbi:hypothetical protein EVAR_99494_1 [Eumeta japonica]|uniref:Uncharacterized protein n=1 Tax=Eumeta variegata TaxID=151549 RepID=A0A4C1Z6X5_EUMVA|nr:hypothetical protein EVAR_99494_1 [Eumeta japonica]